MGLIRLRSFMDFMSRGIMVKLCCRSCGHSREFDPTGLSHLFLRRGWSPHVRTAERMFRCSKCRTKNCEIVPGGLTRD